MYGSSVSKFFIDSGKEGVRTESNQAGTCLDSYYFYRLAGRPAAARAGYQPSQWHPCLLEPAKGA